MGVPTAIGVVEVHVTPAEREDFPQAQAGGDRYNRKAVEQGPVLY